MINSTTTTTDKVQIGSSTTGKTTTSSWQTYKAEQGWECPRCGRINAPWVRQCDCSRNYTQDKWDITWNKDDCAKPWWYDYKVTCKGTSGQPQIDSDTFRIHPESTTWKTPSTTCVPDIATISKSDPNIIYTHATDTNSIVGGSDYKVSSVTTEYVNTPKTYTNSVKEARK